MKRWIIAFIAIVIFAVVLVYILIPTKVELSKTVYVNVASDAVYRNVSNQNKWEQWWRAKSSDRNLDIGQRASSLDADSINYKIVHKTIDAIDIVIAHDGDTINSSMLVIPLPADSTAIYWKGFMETGFAPFGKIKRYQKAKVIRKNLAEVLARLQGYLEKQENIYGFNIKTIKVTDTLLLTTKIITTKYPATTEIYGAIKRLEEYIGSEKAQTTSYPMINVYQTDDKHFETQIAIPTNKRVTSKDDFIFKRMVPGKILVAEIKGGTYTIEQGLSELEAYVRDHQLKSPAIPFQSLVTDRLTTPDTTKWITRIYYPIF